MIRLSQKQNKHNHKIKSPNRETHEHTIPRLPGTTQSHLYRGLLGQQSGGARRGCVELEAGEMLRGLSRPVQSVGLACPGVDYIRPWPVMQPWPAPTDWPEGPGWLVESPPTKAGFCLEIIRVFIETIEL
jgi:hypothetical protein